MRKYFLFFLFFFFFFKTSPFDHIRDFLVHKYCFKSDVSRNTSWLCAYYFALKKDLFKRESIAHPNPMYQAQEELWRDFYVAKEKILPLRVQLEQLKSKYQQDWLSNTECFDFNEKKFNKRRSYLPCVKLVNEFRKSVKKNKVLHESTS